LQFFGFVLAERRDQAHCGGWKLEVHGQDADDPERRAIEGHELTHDVGVHAEARTPEGVAEERHPVGTFVAFLREEIASEDRLDSEDRQERCRDAGVPARVRVRLVVATGDY
jgi:hypothetical protein